MFDPSRLAALAPSLPAYEIRYLNGHMDVRDPHRRVDPSVGDVRRALAAGQPGLARLAADVVTLD